MEEYLPWVVLTLTPEKIILLAKYYMKTGTISEDSGDLARGKDLERKVLSMLSIDYDYVFSNLIQNLEDNKELKALLAYLWKKRFLLQRTKRTNLPKKIRRRFGSI